MLRSRLAVATALLFSFPTLAIPANRVIVQTTNVPASPCSQGTINISIENDVDLYSVSIPLVARSLSGPGFWTSVNLRPSSGRLASSLSAVQSLETGRVNFSAPGQLALYFEASNGANCLPAGALEPMTGLTFRNGGIGGQFEIDTAMYPPCSSPQFTACADQQPIVWDQFVKGVINIFDLPPGGGCNSFMFFDSSSLHAWAGAQLSNDAYYTDPEGDPAGFKLVSGTRLDRQCDGPVDVEIFARRLGKL